MRRNEVDMIIRIQYVCMYVCMYVEREREYIEYKEYIEYIDREYIEYREYSIKSIRYNSNSMYVNRY